MTIDSRSARRSLSLAALVALVLAIVAPAAAAQSEPADNGPAVIVANRVDATSSPIEVTLLADRYDFGAEAVTVVENDETKEVAGIQRATDAGLAIEIVYVIDTSNRLAQGNILDKVKSEVAASIRSLPAGSTVAVVDAGDTSVLRAAPTTDLESAAVAVEALGLSGASRLFNSIDRAAALIDPNLDRISTMVVFSGGPDIGSQVSAAQVQTAVLLSEAQLIAIRYQGGETELDSIVAKSGGLTLGADSGDVSSAMATALGAASDRMILRYPGNVDSSIRSTASISVGNATTSYSHAGGIELTKPVSFPPSAAIEPSGFAFFRSEIGFYAALALAFAGIGLAVFSLGSLFANGDSSLEGMIARYSGETTGDDLNDAENVIVQTALVRRAVEFSESFAEDRGFLVKVEEMLERAKLPLRAGEAMFFWFVISLVSGAVGMLFMGSFVGGVVFVLLGAFGQIGFLRFKARRRIRKFEQQLPDTLTLLASTLRAGYSLPQGIEAVSHEVSDPMGYELRRVMTEARLGREIEEALASAAERLSSPDFAWAVMAIGIQREVGGNLNELLMTVADTMIARERLKGEVAALTAEGKASTILLGALPPGLGFVMWIMNPAYINQLFSETLGNIMLGAAFVMMAIGMAWMKKVMTINV